MAALLSALRLCTMSDNVDLNPWNNEFDRRSVGRTKITKGALLFLTKNTGVQSCTVRDVTNLGAGICAPNLQIMPLDFELSFDGFRTARKCRLIWRQEKFIGVAFAG
jgi:hypothetical protein